MAHLGSRGSKEKWKYEEGGRNKQVTAQDSRKRPNGAVVCVLLRGEGLWGGEGRTSTNDFPPLGGRVCAGGLLLGIGGWAAELVQHGLIPGGRAEEEGQSSAWTGWAQHGSLTPRPFCPETCPCVTEVASTAPGKEVQHRCSVTEAQFKYHLLLAVALTSCQGNPSYVCTPIPSGGSSSCMSHLFPLSFIIIITLYNPVPH